MPPVGHFDEGSLLVIPAHQILLRVQTFQIGADGTRLGQNTPVIQFEGRNLRKGAFASEGSAFCARWWRD